MNTLTAFITGANKGIGLETARILTGKGYHVFIGSRDPASGAKAIEQLQSEGLKNVASILINVTKEASVQEAYKELSRLIPRLDVLVNNAGIPGKFPQPATTADDENLKTVFETNFFGPIRVTRIFLELLKKSDQPRIVNVTSDLGSLTLHNDPSWVYYAFNGPTGKYISDYGETPW
ncbi:MAG TPA: SDR family NAD(P)-dependent oxidoreductase [Puia sp.]|nr:SDR family NAD(P)-dependent oxidoreductase [Puia sp.]